MISLQDWNTVVSYNSYGGLQQKSPPTSSYKDTVDQGSDSCKPWTRTSKKNRRRNLWFDGRVISNVYCDQKKFVDSDCEACLHRTCNFRKNSVCYDLNNNEWIINPKTGNIYNNILLLNDDISDIKNSDDNHLFDNDEINTINLNFASKGIHSAEDIIWWKYKIKKLNENTDNIYYDKMPTLYGQWTEHFENFGHVVFDSYLASLITINNWFECGINRDSKFNILLSSNNKSNFDDSIGVTLFNNINTIQNVSLFYSNYSYVCYDNLIIGTSQQEMLFGGVHLQQQMLKFMRNQILSYYDHDPFWSPKTRDDINMLILIKNTSAWNHMNYPINLDTEVIKWINNKYINKTISNLYIINPAYTSFQKQLELIHKSSIILCQWGGISFSNFLSPLKSVEIIITTYEEKHGYIKTDNKWKNDKIPDFDMPARDAISTQITLRYWDKTDSSRILYLKQDILENLIDTAINVVYSNYDII